MDEITPVLLSLTKEVPARTETIVFLWVQRHVFKMDADFREIRSKHRNPLDTCFWCKYKFQDGDMMSLGGIAKRGNKMLCDDCYQEVIK
jgi:hypothetical protein